MDDKPKKIIIKRVKKGHGGHHGGSWKVAYADFVTAMMAFFLLMWLLNMSSQEKRAVLALYFKNFSLFEHGGKSFMMQGGMSTSTQQSGGSEIIESQENSGGVTKEETVAKMLSGVEKDAKSVKDQVIVGTSDEGIRIQIVDTPENPIFPAGSAQMTEAGKRIVRSVVGIIRNFPNEIVVEGHTDGSPIRNEQVSNWELSTARASAARRQLEVEGIDPNRIARVVGFADKSPLIKDRPEDPRNRRISLLFVKNASARKPTEQFNWMWKQPQPNKN
ncbi:MAG: flagellar motor protein MotB [Acidobacteriota bacterium]